VAAVVVEAKQCSAVWERLGRDAVLQWVALRTDTRSRARFL